MTINIGSILFAIRYLLLLSIPFLFVISPYLVLGVVFILCLIYKRWFSIHHEPAFVFLFMFLMLFWGITIAGVRLYDLAIVFGFIGILFSGNRLKIKMDIPLFFASVLLIFFINYHDYSAITVVRYFLSLILLFTVMNTRQLFPKNKKIFNDIIVAAIYFAFCIYAFQATGIFSNTESGLVQTNIYMDPIEVRMNGFFSDPNKYMAYMFIFLYFIEIFWEDSERKLPLILCSAGTVLSFSRTAILVLLLFLLGKSLITKPKYKTLMSGIIVISFVFSILILFAIPDTVLEWANDFFIFTGSLFGREQTLKQMQSLGEDNRILIWKFALSYIQEAPLFGHGWLSERYLLPYPTHNTMLQLLLDGGIVALGSFIALFRRMFFNSKWLIGFPLLIVPILVLDMSDFRMEYLVLGAVWWLDTHKDGSFKGRLYD